MTISQFAFVMTPIEYIELLNKNISNHEKLHKYRIWLLIQFGWYIQQIWDNIDGVSSHDTLVSVAAEPFYVLHMDPMSDVSMCNQLLVAHLHHPI
jgi:hypothetical protein